MYGQTAELWIGHQDSFDMLATSMSQIPFVSEDLGLNITHNRSQSQRKAFDQNIVVEGVRTCDGTISMEADAFHVGRLFKSFFNGYVFGLINSYVTGHTFYLSDPTLYPDFDYYAAKRPVTIIKQMQVNSGRYGAGLRVIMNNMIANTLEMSISQGEIVTCKVGFVGGAFSYAVQQGPAVPVAMKPLFTWNNSSISVGMTTSPVAIYSYAGLKQLTLSIDEGLAAHHTLRNSLYPSHIKRASTRKIDIAGTFILQNTDEYYEFLQQYRMRLQCILRNTTISIQSGFYPRLDMSINGFKYSDVRPIINGAGLLEVNFRGTIDATSGGTSGLTYISLTNTHTSSY